MKICSKCGKANEDSCAFCLSCGAPLGNSAQPVQNVQNVQNVQQPVYGQPPVYAPVYDAADHTAEFDPKDISDNKVYAMCVYLLGVLGIIIALLAAPKSPYVSFHLRQALKFSVVEILISIISVILVWTIIVPVAASIFVLVLYVIKIICFFQICSGKAKEPAIIRSLSFLK